MNKKREEKRKKNEKMRIPGIPKRGLIKQPPKWLLFDIFYQYYGILYDKPQIIIEK
jgi:hypothetical protein